MFSMPRHAGHALLAAALACALAAASAQQPPPAGSYYDDDSGQQQVSTAMVALLAAVVAVFVFIAASTVFLRHCSGYAASSRSPAGDGRAVVVLPSLDALLISRSWWQRRRGGPRGLHAEVVEAFPTMTYAEAKALRVGKGAALECAVCLSEFEDGERLRLLLPKCSHAFHPDCIGEWLAGHVTCPVCRCNLEPTKDTISVDGGEPSFPPTIPLASSVSSETANAAWQVVDGSLPVAVVIDVVTEEGEEARRQEALELQRIGTQRRAMRSPSGLRSTTATELAPWQWHSTGHSVAAWLDRDLERFTLRLPEHVRREMVDASEHSLQSRRGRRPGAEAASACSAPVVGRLGRWQSLLGSLSFSGKLSFFSAPRMSASTGGGEVSSSSVSSYTRLRGKRVAAVDVPDDVPPKRSGSEAGTASREVAAVADEEMAVKHAVGSDVELEDLNAVET